MTARSPAAFFLSATFHAAVIGMIFLFALIARQQESQAAPRVLELVAGGGDNYAATVAPRLGSSEGAKFEVPRLPGRRAPAPPVDATPVPAPAPKPVAPPRVQPSPAGEKVPNFAREIQRARWAGEWRAKRRIAHERRLEQARQKEEERRRRELEVAEQKARSRRARSVEHIDVKGIEQGVLGGSEENAVGGAGGKALVRTEGSVLDAYYKLLNQRVEAALDKPAGVSDGLVVTVRVNISADGRLSNPRVVRASGNDDWDHAIIEAFKRVEMPPYPKHMDDVLEQSYRAKDVGGG